MIMTFFYKFLVVTHSLKCEWLQIGIFKHVSIKNNLPECILPKEWVPQSLLLTYINF